MDSCTPLPRGHPGPMSAHAEFLVSIDETGTSPVCQLEGGLMGDDAVNGGSSFSSLLPTSLKIWVHIWKFMPLLVVNSPAQQALCSPIAPHFSHLTPSILVPRVQPLWQEPSVPPLLKVCRVTLFCLGNPYLTFQSLYIKA